MEKEGLLALPSCGAHTQCSPSWRTGSPILGCYSEGGTVWGERSTEPQLKPQDEEPEDGPSKDGRAKH